MEINRIMVIPLLCLLPLPRLYLLRLKVRGTQLQTQTGTPGLFVKGQTHPANDTPNSPTVSRSAFMISSSLAISSSASQLAQTNLPFMKVASLLASHTAKWPSRSTVSATRSYGLATRTRPRRAGSASYHDQRRERGHSWPF